MYEKLPRLASLAAIAMLVSCANLTPQQSIQNDRSCNILNEGNEFYTAKKFDSAVEIYKKIESDDIESKGQCSGSIYATLATIYTYYGDDARKTDPERAIIAYKTASRYNRRFAQAVANRLRRYEPSTP
jgi:tetratricopeptide (TPR) repeat protein